MKLFLKYIIGAFVFVIVTLVVLDTVYTKVFENKVVSSKSKYLTLLENKHYDAVFLGSSRVDNHIVTSAFEKQNIKVLNAGIQGVHLKDNLLFLKILISNKVTFKRVFVQIDYGYNNNDFSLASSAGLLPYFRKPVISDYLKSEFKNYNSYYYVPFYRYAVNDYRIGFRGVFTNLLNKRKNEVFNDYKPLFGTSEMSSFSLPNKLSENTDAFNKIKSFCEDNNIEVIYFTAPFCSKLKPSPFTQLLADEITNYRDYSTIYTDDLLFSSCGHLNNKGAVKFTHEIISDYFKE